MARLIVTFAAAAAIAVQGSAALAQQWPARTIEIVVPAGPGSGPDITIRPYTERLARSLGRPVIVSNRPGGSGTIGPQAVARAAPDGYTFLLATSGHLIINKYAIKNLSYDPDRDFEPVTLLNRAPLLVLTNPRLPTTTLSEFIAYSKKSEAKIFAAFESPSQKVALGFLGKVTGMDLTLVPYLSQTQAAQELIAGQSQLYIQGTQTLSLVKDGRLRALAVTTDYRSRELPNVPTIMETYPEFGNFEVWVMLLAPKGTPAAIVSKMADEMGRISNLPEIKKTFDDLGILPAESGSPEAAVRYLRAQNEQFAKMAAAADLQPE